MAEHELDRLRSELRNLGYLEHGIERWFALDPWSSRAFWAELATVAAKAAGLLTLFLAAPAVGIMAVRNDPLAASGALLLSGVYAVAGFVTAFLVVLLAALVLKLKPGIAVDRPRALLGASIASSLVLLAPLTAWWSRFDTPPSVLELAVGGALLVALFSVATLVLSAALLSFSIHETRRIPAIARRSNAIPIAMAAALLAVAIVVLPLVRGANEKALPPPQIVTSPSSAQVALLAVDGLSTEVLSAQPRLRERFRSVVPARGIASRSAAELWATIGTGTEATVHGVHAIEGIRPRGGSSVLQVISRADLPLRIAARTGIAEAVALPPTARERHFVWEVFASRGIASAAVNWWASEDSNSDNLHAVGQASLYAQIPRDLSPSRSAAAIDRLAAAKLLALTDAPHPRFATAYLPALDIVLNRLELDQAGRLALSVSLLDGLAELSAELQRRGYSVVLVGVPGGSAGGSPVIASDLTLAAAGAGVDDVAPTLCALFGFPATEEMPGKPLAGDTTRIATFGERRSRDENAAVDPEYYEKLRALGYVK